ncbi:MAG: hypothetical protein JRH11_21290 [Deltaproteobacteria bacterium]|nr:hypothetical protein [Deltaproteobacteria bacterium]
MNNSRREFLSSLLAVGAGVGLVTVIGCGDDDPATDSGTPTDSGMTGDSMMGSSCDSWNTEIGSNHSHAMTVSAADVTAGVEKTYDIMGSSSHSHSVTITAANFTDLAAGTTVTANSTSGGSHTHGITVTCAGA